MKELGDLGILDCPVDSGMNGRSSFSLEKKKITGKIF